MDTSNSTTQSLTLGRVMPPIEIAEDVAHENFGPSVEACVWALAVLAAGWLGLRLYLKFRKHRGLWWDDRFLAIVSDIMNYVSPSNLAILSASFKLFYISPEYKFIR